MICLCIKEKLLEKYQCNPLLLDLSLMACSWCKRMQNSDFEVSDSNKYQMMFIESLFCTMKQSDEVIMRMFDIYLLEEIQDKFEEDKKCDEEIHKFLKIVERMQDGSNPNLVAELHKCYEVMSEYALLELIKRLIFHSEFSLAQTIILEYFQINVTILSNSFRKRFYFRPKESDEVKAIFVSPNSAKYQYYSCEPFFDIGYALDEGQVESATQQMMKSITDDYKPDGSYFFEVKFFNKLMSIFDEDKRKHVIGQIAFENYATTLISKLTDFSDNKCDFYNFYHYTDNQNWREANLLLNKILKSNIDLESL